jgi:uncharacterized protein (TIGR04255 family)
MKLQPLQPFAGTHAIQQANFNFHWVPLPVGVGDGLGESCVAELYSLMVGAGLQSIIPINAVQIQVSAAGAAPSASVPSSPQGFQGRLPAVAGMPGFLVTVSVTDGILIQVAPYTRWAPALAKVMELVRTLLPAACKLVPLTRVGLQVVDSFNWNGPVSEMPIDAVFDRNSPWMAPHVFDCGTFWHTNHGYFEPTAEPDCIRQLNNINVSVSGAPERPLLQVACVHVAELSDGAWQLQDVTQVERLVALLEHLHSCNKRTIGQLLTPEVAERVALWGPPSREVGHAGL